MTERFVSIDPSKRVEYQEIIERKFRIWHQEEYKLVYPFKIFRQSIADASFLAYLDHFLKQADDKGQIDLAQAERNLRENLGEYYREEKFQKTVIFIKDCQWNYL